MTLKLYALACSLALSFCCSIQGFAAPEQSSFTLTNEQFRNEIVQYVLAQAQQKDQLQAVYLDEIDKKMANYYQSSDWSFRLSCYQKGRVVGESQYENPKLVEVLFQAVTLLKNQVANIQDCQFKFDFSYYPNRHYAFISYQKKGLELTGNRVAVRQVSADNLHQQIQDSVGYLLRVMHPELHGFYKYYDASQDLSEQRLRTIYSASSLWTLISAQKADPSFKLEPYFKPIAAFILSQQLKKGPNQGAFYYSIKVNKHSPAVVVGTASKTIFTLILMNELYPQDPQYLDAAKQAGNWLVKQVLEDGKVVVRQHLKKGHWIITDKQSFLFSGQVLSALSRLYRVTGDKAYYLKAKLIADHFVKQVALMGPILGDDYRPANPISSSWVLMSLMDFAKVDSDKKYIDTTQQIAKRLRQQQMTNTDDIYYVGKYIDSMTTSGNGWLNEVFGNYYPFCKLNHLDECEQYREAMILTSRWLMQNAYHNDNTYNVTNPQHAIGAFILNYHNQLVRTDAVCHGVNSLLSLLATTTATSPTLLDIKEQPLDEVLSLIRAGDKKVE